MYMPGRTICTCQGELYAHARENYMFMPGTICTRENYMFMPGMNYMFIPGRTICTCQAELYSTCLGELYVHARENYMYMPGRTI